MTLATYSELVSEVESFLNRTDVSDRIPTAILLFESWCNRELRLPQMEATVTATTTADEESVSLPEDFRQARSLYLDADPIRVLEYMAPAALRATYAANESGQPIVYTMEDEVLVLAPVPDGEYSLVLNYSASIPGLTASNTTNWLLAKHPDAYLAGTLAYMYGFLRDNEEAAKWEGVLGTILGAAKRESNRERVTGPLIMRGSSIA